MPLPPKGWFKLAEIAQRWGVEICDVEHYALEGMLQLSVFVVGVRAEYGSLEPDDHAGVITLLEGRCVLNGPQPLRSCSLLEIVRQGRAVVWHLEAGKDRYLLLDDRGDPLIVEREDLIVTRQERDRFEDEYQLEFDRVAATVAASSEPRDEPMLQQESDFRVVHFADRKWQLGVIQAAIVRQLHEAWRSGRHWMSGKELLRQSGASSVRMRDLFKGHAEWRNLIVSDGRGNYRLNLPVQRVRVFRRSWSAGQGRVRTPALVHG